MKNLLLRLFVALFAIVGISSCAKRNLDAGHSNNYWKTRHNTQNTKFRYAYPDHDRDRGRHYH